MAGDAHAHAFVGWRLDVAACVAGSRGRNSLDVFEDGLDAPEAASGKNCGLLALGRGQRCIDGWNGNQRLRLFWRPGAKRAKSSSSDQSEYHYYCDASSNIGALH